jgi:hypothetical protein
MSLSQLVYSRLRPKVIAEAAWSDIVGAVQGLGANQKAQILEAAKRKDFEAVGKRIVTAFHSVLEAKTQTEATAILADGALSAEEIERLLG